MEQHHTMTDDDMNDLFARVLAADPDAPPWTVDRLQSTARHQVRARDRLTMAVQILLGGPVSSYVTQYTDTAVSRASAVVSLSTDWPRWITRWRRSHDLEAR